MHALLLSLAWAQEAPATTPVEDAPVEARSYTLDPASSRLYVVVAYDRSATIAGHDHIVAASTFDGAVTWNTADVGACSVKISFPVTALTVDPGSSRSWEGLDGSTSEGDKAKIKENLAGKHQLQADMFPQISFQSTSCAVAGDKVEVRGNLSIHGKTKAVSAKMTVTAGDSFAAKGTFTATHADFGMEPFSALLGALRNAPELKFVVDVKGA